VSFGLFLRTDNPGGRADISCGNVTVRLLDMPHGRTNFTGMTEVSQLKLLGSFVVKRMSSHTIKKWVSINDTSVTSHIATTYGGRTSFWGMVEVNMTIVSATPVAQTSPRYVSHSCGPLIVSVDEPSNDAEAVPCIGSDQEEDGLFS